MIKVYQIELSDEKVAEVNAPGGGWHNVAWGKTYLDLTMGRWGDGDNVSVMEMIIEAIEFGLVKHTMTIETDSFNRAFDIGNGEFFGDGDIDALVDHCTHKSVSIGDIFIRNHNEGAVVAECGFDDLSREEIREIESLVPQHFEFTKDV